jgi:hypothetical protein
METVFNYIYNILYRIFIGKKNNMVKGDDKLKNVDWNKYSNDAIDFMLLEGNEYINFSITSFREMTNKSYALITIYLALIAFSFNKITYCYIDSIPYYFLSFCISVSLILLYKNITPNKVSFGVKPEIYIHEFYEKEIPINYQITQYKIGKIKSLSKSIQKNTDLNKIRSDNFSSSVNIATFTIIVYAILVAIF